MLASRLTLPLCTLLALTCSCATLLGLDEAKPYPSECDTSEPCSDGEQCVNNRCEPIACVPGATRCSGLKRQECGSDGDWKDVATCTAQCTPERCIDPPSCGNIPQCPGDVSCCKAHVVTGGEFKLRYAYGQPSGSDRIYMQGQEDRRVPSFALDRFEVTVSRFRRFFDGYAGHLPEEGDGELPGIPGSGWQASWSDNSALLPRSEDTLKLHLEAYGQRLDNTEDANLPVRGVNWYIAFAFCIWDGGRLPSETEWSYAASGGDQQRDYPWANTDLDSAIHQGLAWYDVDSPHEVGTRTDGRGLWEHEDLAGNVQEWVFDGYRGKPEPAPCAAEDGPDAANRWHCLQLTLTNGTQRVLRGGAYPNEGMHLQNVRRTSHPSEAGHPTIGFRCARDL